MSGQRTRTAVIVGAASHIGRAVVTRYLASGYRVRAFVGPTGPEGLEGLSAVAITSLDLSDLSAVEQCLDNHADVRDADALILLAADVRATALPTASADDLMRAVSIGALSGFLFMGAAGPAMKELGYGRIVTGSSIGVRFGGGTDSFAYALSRHTAEFIPQEARMWARHGVLTNVIRIGVTDTAAHSAFPGRDLAQRVGLIPAGRAATVDEVADYLHWHGSEANTFVTGQLLAISGGE